MDRAISRAVSPEDLEESQSLFESLHEAVRNSAARARRAAECTLASGARAAPSAQGRLVPGTADLYAALEKQVDSILRSAGLAPDAA